MTARERVRVARVIARMNVGGPAQQIARLVGGMDAERYDHRLLCGQVEDGEADFITLREPDLPHIRLSSLRRSLGPAGDLRTTNELIRYFRRFRPHIVHTHTAKAGVVGRIAARAAGVPIIVHTFHGHLLHGYFGPRGTHTVIQIERRLARRTDVLMAVGTAVRDDLLAAGVGRADQYRVVPPGVAVAEVPSREEARAALEVGADVPLLVFVGRLVPVKRVDRLIDATRLILRRLPATQLLIAGEGPELRALRLAAAELGDRVRFLGWRGDVERLYTAADLVVLTSDNEGMPVGLIEASLCGTPCVTTDVGSAREVVIDGVTGRITTSSPGAIADAALGLLEDQQRLAAAGAAAREHAERSFSARRLVDDVQASYEELLRDRGLRIGGDR